MIIKKKKKKQQKVKKSLYVENVEQTTSLAEILKHSPCRDIILSSTAFNDTSKDASIPTKKKRKKKVEKHKKHLQSINQSINQSIL